jgi:Family of unknown function (DUF6262)
MKRVDTRDSRIETLKKTQESRKQDCLERVYKAIERLQKIGAKINFHTVAKEANLSVSYLYKYPELKQHLAQLRSQQSSMPVSPQALPGSSSHAKVVSRLKERILQLESQNQELRRKNEALAGQVYRVHYLQEQVERQQQTIEDLQKRMKDTHDDKSTAKVTPIPSKRKAEVTDQIKAELDKLKISLNPTLNKKIKQRDEQTVLAAIAALKDQLQRGEIKNPGGWLARAIEEEWTMSQSINQQEKSHYPEGFEQWYAEAIEVGFVLDIPANYLSLDSYNQPIVKIDRSDTFGAPYTTMNWKDAREEMKSL